MDKSRSMGIPAWVRQDYQPEVQSFHRSKFRATDFVSMDKSRSMGIQADNLKS